jgi:hypothetical protein
LESDHLRWERLAEYLENNLEGHMGKRVLITARYIFLNQVLIGLLKFLLEKRKAKGIYIAVDRPYHYTSKLLEKHKIPTDGLFFIDAVSIISSEKIERAPNAELIDAPFCVNLTNDVNEKLERMDTEHGDMSFVFLDNITVMLNYIDQDCLENFLGTIVIKFPSGKTITITVVDKEAHPKTYEVARAKSDAEISITREALSG